MTQQPTIDEAQAPLAVSLEERRTRTLKCGDIFGVFDVAGNVVGGPGSSDGIYFRDTRHLSKFDLLIGDERPMLLSSTLRDDNAELTCDLTNPDLFESGEVAFPRDVLHLRRSRFLWDAACFERLSVHSFAEGARRVRIEVHFGADFMDLFEVRGMVRPSHGARLAPECKPNEVTLGYLGLDQQRRTTRLRFEPTPTSLDGNRAVFEFDVSPQAPALCFVETSCNAAEATEPARHAFNRALFQSRRRLRKERGRAAAVTSSNEVFNEAMRRSTSDLYMLMTDKLTGPYPYAGVPWFSAAFGRDALITALQTLWLDPSVSLGVLAYLAKNQATEVDKLADAEPGKILHEVRYGEMAELHEVPFRRYYGSVDSTPLFVMLAGAYVERTGDIAAIGALWPNILAAMEWIDVYGDRDRDGFVEYHRQSDSGLANQGWKDSHDSVFHADGALATGPIALAEVQGYAYAARRSAALIARLLGHNAQADAFETRAAWLQREFESAFWCEDIGTYALALDGKKRPCRVRASNAGHLLLTGIATPEHGKRIAKQLTSTRFFSGWGVRTVALGEARFNPMSYHNGSIWPHDNALIALGMARYGCRAEATKVFAAMFDASQSIELRRLPELFCGFPRRRGQAPTDYPVACSPQAWSATALLAMLQACLGLSFDPANCLVKFNQPILPARLTEVTLRNLVVGGGCISVQLRRMGAEVAMHVLEREGPIQVTLTS